MVKTKDGYKKIEQIQVGDQVTSYDFKHKSYVERNVVSLCRKHVKSYLQISTHKGTLNVTYSHKFYLPLKKEWVRAYHLHRGDVLLSAHGKPIVITQVCRIKKEAEIANLAVEKNHNFLVSHHDILVHNFFPCLAIPFIIEFGIGGISIAWAAMGEVVLQGLMYAAVGYIGSKLTDNHKRQNDYYRDLYRDLYFYNYSKQKSQSDSANSSDKQGLLR